MNALFRSTPGRLALAAAAVLLLIAAGIAVGIRLARPEVTREEVREAVISTIQREAPASFYVTGTLDVVATTSVENTKYFLPDLLGFDLGTTSATVRMPGRISYGFDVRALKPEMIDVGEDGVVRVTLPELQVHAVEPDLSRMEVQTSVGWARLSSSSGRRVERRAIQIVQKAFREQGQEHVRTATQPRVNTAEALERLLAPVLQAAGVEEPRFRFQIGPELVMQPEE